MIRDIAINTIKIAPASFCNRAVHGNMISRLHFQITEVAQLRTVHPPAYEIYRCRHWTLGRDGKPNDER
nr:hypothetical protein Itr_chr14CG14040 [Ipomoea trifida]GLL49346.1 hypothetical protein Itr_chr15CG08960 [Ipomoea trifida]